MSIQAEKLRFGYTEKAVLADVSFAAADGQLLAVLGPNGVGKTTLFRCVLGLERHFSGTIRIDGDEAKDLPERELARRIAFIPQIRPQVFGYSVLEMVLMGTSHRISSFRVPGAREKEQAMAALAQLHIEELAEHEFVKISGGEQQLVLIARALAQNSRNLLMDEPTSALDYGNQARVMQAVRNLADEGYCVVLSTHNPQHALWYADHVLAMGSAEDEMGDNGQTTQSGEQDTLDSGRKKSATARATVSGGTVVADGAPAEVMTEDLIRRLYRMDVRILQTERGPLITPEITEER